jgi:hypothetical protein
MQWQSMRTTKGIKVPAGPVQGVFTLSWWASPTCCQKIAKKAFSTYSCTFVHNAACSQSLTHLRCACVYLCSVPNPSNPAGAKQCGERREGEAPDRRGGVAGRKRETRQRTDIHNAPHACEHLAVALLPACVCVRACECAATPSRAPHQITHARTHRPAYG